MLCLELMHLIDFFGRVKNNCMVKVIIVGSGFGGTRCALDLAKKHLTDVEIILVSDKEHFEYQPGLYRIVTGQSTNKVCIPLKEIFNHQNVEVIEDKIIGVNLLKKTIKGKSDTHYSFDFLVLALGSETLYFDIPGLKDLSFGFKSITEALKLKDHLHHLFSSTKDTPINIVVVGGGATGVELAGELTSFAKTKALVNIELIEAAPRLLPAFTEDVSKKVQKRLENLGVKVFLNRKLIKEDVEKIYLKDMKLKTKTVIWTAGVKPNHLYSQIKGFEFDDQDRVLVDQFLQAKGINNVFVIGDDASTPFAGMAQTALLDAKLVATNIVRKLQNLSPLTYHPHQPIYAIPVGPCWATVVINQFKIYGRGGWILRRLADLKFFLSILPLTKALSVLQNSKTHCKSSNFCYHKK